MISLQSRASAYEFGPESGDVILLGLTCRSCSMISDETGSSYNHVGVVIRDPLSKRLFVAQALSTVHLLPIDEFFALLRKKDNYLILRSKTIARFPIYELNFINRVMWERFHKEFNGLGYDRKYLWNNHDSRGELLYCSEFVAKFLAPFLEYPFVPSKMTFIRNYDFWFKFFDGQVPEGKPGLSPGDLLYNDEFFILK